MGRDLPGVLTPLHLLGLLLVAFAVPILWTIFAVRTLLLRLR